MDPGPLRVEVTKHRASQVSRPASHPGMNCGTFMLGSLRMPTEGPAWLPHGLSELLQSDLGNVPRVQTRWAGESGR